MGNMLIDRPTLSVLNQLGRGERFGLELLAGSGGTLVMGTLYVHLARMEGAGLVEGWAEAPYGRRKYRITDLGRSRSRPPAATPERIA